MAAYGESDIERIMQTEGMLKHRPKIELLSIMLLLLNVFNLNLVRFVTIFGDLQIIKRLFMKTIQKVISLQRMGYLRGLAKT